jgi:hypothetical protein
VSQYIKGSPEHGCPPLKPELKTVAVEPMEQMLITAARGGEKIGPQGPHKIQGYVLCRGACFLESKYCPRPRLACR